MARRGLTLLELLLALALLVIVAGLAAPSVVGSFSSVRLRRGGDAVLEAMSRARFAAIESGEIFQFRFAPEERGYRADPWTGGVDERAPASSTKSGIAKTASGTRGSEPKGIVEGELTEPLRFRSGEVLAADPTTGATRVRSAQESRDEWSTPILFYPDGTAIGASVVISNDREQCVRITVRGLTGFARASGVLSRDQLDRSAR